MRLSQLLPDLPRAALNRDPEIAGISEDSRRIQPGWLFVAVPGTTTDGRLFVREALGRGAAAIVTEAPAPPLEPAWERQAPVLLVPSARSALAHAAARYHQEPARELRLIGFTGTFGKTSTSEVLRALLAAAGRRPAAIGSLGIVYGAGQPDSRAAHLTTPAPVELHGALRQVRDAGADTVVLEVTTHALRMHRIEGLRFQQALVAAIMPGEHTDFHHSYRDYVAAKRLLVEYLEPGALLAYDADNAAARTMACAAGSARLAAMSVGTRSPGRADDICLRNVEVDARGALFTVRGERLRSSLLGAANVRNVGLALALALACDVDIRAARRVLAGLQAVPRRMQRRSMAGRLVLDDVAAHPDSFKGVFDVAALLPHRRLIVVHALRGSRGLDINRRNAVALGDLAALHDASALILTAALDEVGPKDQPAAEEIDVTRRTLAERASEFEWHDTVSAAVAEAARRSSPGDLIVLVGAQAMTNAAHLLEAALG